MLVIELAGGGELFDFMMYTGAFPEEVARTYFRQMMSALLLCHESGIYHRDIKPENLLLSRGNVKLADFGWAVHALSREYRTTLCGTPEYLAPEVVGGRRYNHKVDNWSLGVLAYELVCGETPFRNTGSDAELEQEDPNESIYDRILAFEEGQLYASLSSDAALRAAQEFATAVLRPNPEGRPSLGDMLAHAFLRE
mmetsp:Transcript_42223/g.132218  ORF Transcript_42223/g.132218 Transcript_42223/m.132218 type:complete len:196 (-) Transcript_42223:2283-2870(-)